MRRKPVSAMTVAEKRSRAEHLWAVKKYRSYGNGIDGFKQFCCELYQVRSKVSDSGRSLFKLYDFQEELAEAYFSERFHVVLKSRQLGATTLAMCYGLWLCLFKPGGAQILCVSKTQVDARANLEQVMFAINFFPEYFRDQMPEIIASSNDKVVFQLRDGVTSSIECMVATERTGASRTADLVLADEAALYSNPEGTFRSLTPVTDAAASKLEKSAVMIVFSTARGGSNYFAQLYRDAAAGRNQYKAHFVPWFKNPLSNPLALKGGVDRSVIEARKQEFAQQPHMFFAEYPETPEEAFYSSGASRFQGLPSSMEFEDFPLRGNMVASGIEASWLDEINGPMWVNFDPRDKADNPANYKPIFIGADSALGVGSDYSVAYAVAYDGKGPMEIVAYFASNTIEPLDFADTIWAMSQFFGSATRAALTAVEINPSGGGGGSTVVGRLRDRGHNNLYNYVQRAHKGRKALNYYGIPATRSVKPLLINNLAEWLLHDPALGEEGTADGLPLQFIPPILRDELGSFVVMPNGSTGADQGAHDDHVIAVAMAVYIAATTVNKAKNPTVKDSEGEPADSEQVVLTLDLTEMRKDIEQQQKKHQQARRKDMRRLQRQMSGRRRR